MERVNRKSGQSGVLFIPCSEHKGFRVRHIKGMVPLLGGGLHRGVKENGGEREGNGKRKNGRMIMQSDRWCRRDLTP